MRIHSHKQANTNDRPDIPGLWLCVRPVLRINFGTPVPGTSRLTLFVWVCFILLKSKQVVRHPAYQGAALARMYTGLYQDPMHKKIPSINWRDFYLKWVLVQYFIQYSRGYPVLQNRFTYFPAVPVCSILSLLISTDCPGMTFPVITSTKFTLLIKVCCA